MTMAYDIDTTEVMPQLVAATRVRTNLSRIGSDIGAGFGAIMRALGSKGVVPSGPPLVVYHDMIDEETDGDIEICAPIDRAIPDGDGVYARELEGGLVATTVHRGPYQAIAPAYAEIMGWVPQNGLVFAGPPREVYLNDPQEVAPEELLTRVEFPVAVSP